LKISDNRGRFCSFGPKNLQTGLRGRREGEGKEEIRREGGREKGRKGRGGEGDFFFVNKMIAHFIQIDNDKN
jgi:hypothetical protein